MLSVSLERMQWNRHNADPHRHADKGSSCCALFASSLALALLTGAASEVSSVDDLISSQVLQHRAVSCSKLWDAIGHITGQRAIEVLEVVASKKGVQICIDAKEAVVTHEVLTAMISEVARPCAVLVTALPVSAESSSGWSGNTFLMVAFTWGMLLVDTHAHSGHHLQGAVLAKVVGQAKPSAQVMCDWILGKGGLLFEMGCRTELVDASFVSGGEFLRCAPDTTACVVSRHCQHVIINSSKGQSKCN